MIEDKFRGISEKDTPYSKKGKWVYGGAVFVEPYLGQPGCAYIITATHEMMAEGMDIRFDAVSVLPETIGQRIARFGGNDVYVGDKLEYKWNTELENWIKETLIIRDIIGDTYKLRELWVSTSAKNIVVVGNIHKDNKDDEVI